MASPDPIGPFACDSHSADQLVAALQLAPHPEGGWYREIHRSPLQVQRSDGQLRSASTEIFFLLAQEQRSLWHRVLAADEQWQWIAGAPLELWLLPPEGGAPRLQTLLPHGSASRVLVPAHWWQAARSTGRWSLLSCSVAPGFAFEDFELLRDLPVEQHPAGAESAFL